MFIYLLSTFKLTAHKKATLIFLLELSLRVRWTRLEFLEVSQGWTLTHLTYPEVVTPYNIDKSQALVSNGPNKHPGARYMSRNRYFSEPICALETISNNKGIRHSLRHR
jgi:hypothetical protein